MVNFETETEEQTEVKRLKQDCSWRVNERQLKLAQSSAAHAGSHIQVESLAARGWAGAHIFNQTHSFICCVGRRRFKRVRLSCFLSSALDSPGGANMLFFG